MISRLSPAAVAGVAAGGAVLLLFTLLAIVIPCMRRRHRKLVAQANAAAEQISAQYPASHFSLSDDDVARIPGTRYSLCRSVRENYARIPPYTPMASRIDAQGLKSQRPSPDSSKTPPAAEQISSAKGSPAWPLPRRLARSSAAPSSSTVRPSSAQKQVETAPKEQPRASQDSSVTVKPTTTTNATSPVKTVDESAKGLMTPSRDIKPALATPTSGDSVGAKSEKGTSGAKTCGVIRRKTVGSAKAANGAASQRSRSSSVWSQLPGSPPKRPASPLPLGAEFRRLKKSMRQLSPSGLSSKASKRRARKRASTTGSIGKQDTSPKIPEIAKLDDFKFDAIAEEIDRRLQMTKRPLTAGSQSDLKKTSLKATADDVPKGTVNLSGKGRPGWKGPRQSIVGSNSASKSKSFHALSAERRTTAKVHKSSPLALNASPKQKKKHESPAALREISGNTPRTSQISRSSSFVAAVPLEWGPETFLAPSKLAVMNGGKAQLSKQRGSLRISRPPSPKKANTLEQRNLNTGRSHSMKSTSSRSIRSRRRQTVVYRPPSAASFDFNCQIQGSYRNSGIFRRASTSSSSVSSVYSTAREMDSHNTSPKFESSTPKLISSVSTPSCRPHSSRRLEAIFTPGASSSPAQRFTFSDDDSGDEQDCEDHDEEWDPFLNCAAGNEPADFNIFNFTLNTDDSPTAGRQSGQHRQRQQRERQRERAFSSRDEDAARNSPSPSRFPMPPSRHPSHTLSSSIQRSMVRSKTATEGSKRLSGSPVRPLGPRSLGSTKKQGSLRTSRPGSTFSPRNSWAPSEASTQRSGHSGTIANSRDDGNAAAAAATSGMKKGHKRHSHNLSQSMTALRKMTSDAAELAQNAKPVRGSNESKHYLSLRSSADDGYPFDLNSFHPALRPKATAADDASFQPSGSQAHHPNTNSQYDNDGDNQAQPQPRVKWKRHSPHLEPRSLEDELRNCLESEEYEHEGSIGQPSLHSFSNSLSSSSTQRSIKDEGEKWWADDASISTSTNTNSNVNNDAKGERRSTDTIVATSTPHPLDNKLVKSRDGGGDANITRRKSKSKSKSKVTGPRDMPYSYTGTGLESGKAGSGSGSGSGSIRGASKPRGARDMPFRHRHDAGTGREREWERESGSRVYDEKGFLRNSWLEEGGQLG